MTKPDCIFCKIAAKELPSSIIYEDEQIVAFKDINPLAPVHILIIPKKHIDSLNEVSDNNEQLLGHIQVVASRLAEEMGIAAQGYRLVSNCGEWGGQAVLHVHYHLLGGREMCWPPG